MNREKAIELSKKFLKGSERMANNRLRIKCRVCGETFPIAKTMGSGYYLSPAFSEKGLAEFLDDHAFCRKGDEIGDEGDFCIAYEFPEEGQETFTD